MSPTTSLSDKEKLGVEESRLDTIASPPPDTPGPSNATARDAALEVLGDGTVRHQFSEEQDRRVLRKIDLWVMPVVLMVYFLQQLDKCVIYVPCASSHITRHAQVLRVVHFCLRSRAADW